VDHVAALQVEAQHEAVREAGELTRHNPTELVDMLRRRRDISEVEGLLLKQKIAVTRLHRVRTAMAQRQFLEAESAQSVRYTRRGSKQCSRQQRTGALEAHFAAIWDIPAGGEREGGLRGKAGVDDGTSLQEREGVESRVMCPYMVIREGVDDGISLQADNGPNINGERYSWPPSVDSRPDGQASLPGGALDAAVGMPDKEEEEGSRAVSPASPGVMSTPPQGHPWAWSESSTQSCRHRHYSSGPSSQEDRNAPKEPNETGSEGAAEALATLFAGRRRTEASTAWAQAQADTIVGALGRIHAQDRVQRRNIERMNTCLQAKEWSRQAAKEAACVQRAEETRSVEHRCDRLTHELQGEMEFRLQARLRLAAHDASVLAQEDRERVQLDTDREASRRSEPGPLHRGGGGEADRPRTLTRDEVRVLRQAEARQEGWLPHGCTADCGCWWCRGKEELQGDIKAPQSIVVPYHPAAALIIPESDTDPWTVLPKPRGPRLLSRVGGRAPGTASRQHAREQRHPAPDFSL